MQPAYSYNHTEWLLVREGPSGEAQAKRDEKETARKAGERDEKETARKAGDKEKHRLAARDQGNNNMKRKRSKADKDAKQRALSIIQYRKQTEREIPLHGWTEEDALKALVRYHGSTNVAMLLHTDNERIKSNIRKFVRVSPEVKATIRKTFRKAKWRQAGLIIRAQVVVSGITVTTLKKTCLLYTSPSPRD